MSSSLWIWLFVHCTKYVVVIGSVCVNVLVCTLSVTVICLKGQSVWHWQSISMLNTHVVMVIVFICLLIFRMKPDRSKRVPVASVSASWRSVRLATSKVLKKASIINPTDPRHLFLYCLPGGHNFYFSESWRRRFVFYNTPLSLLPCVCITLINITEGCCSCRVVHSNQKAWGCVCAYHCITISARGTHTHLLWHFWRGSLTLLLLPLFWFHNLFQLI